MFTSGVQMIPMSYKRLKSHLKFAFTTWKA